MDVSPIAPRVHPAPAAPPAPAAAAQHLIAEPPPPAATHTTATHECIAYGAEIARAAQRHHLNDPLLLAAIAAQETGGPGSDSGRNIDARPPNRGHGLFQIDAGAWPSEVRAGVADQPGRAADFAARLLSSGLRAHHGDVEGALHDYNAGPDPNAKTTVTAWPDRAMSYEGSVLRHLAQLHARNADLSCR